MQVMPLQSASGIGMDRISESVSRIPAEFPV